jgi:hypothetical protein
VFIESLEPRVLYAGIPQYPDLMPWADKQRGYIYGWSIDTQQTPGRTLLRFSNAAINAGAGVAELNGGPVNPGGLTQQVFQRVYATDGSSKQYLAGNFIYHPQHAHVHFEDFANYNLRIATPPDGSSEGSTYGAGAIQAASEKVSFCLLDSVMYDNMLPGAPQSAQNTSCSNAKQGISVGWADLYDKSLFGQWIDVTDVPSGRYWLEVELDPLNHLSESNERNNMARILIDVHHNDNTFATAYNVGALGGGTSGVQTFYEFVGSADVSDHYKFTVSSAGTVNLNMNELRSVADLGLYDSAGTLLASSTRTGTLPESISRTLAAGTYYVRAVGAVGAETTYTLGMSFTPTAAASGGDLATPPSTKKGPAFERDGWREDKHDRRGGRWSRTAEELFAPSEEAETQIDTN